MSRAMVMAAAAGVLLAVGPAHAGAAEAAPQSWPPSATSNHAALDAAQCALIVKIHVRPEQRDNFLRLIKARIADSRGHRAVIDFRILATADPLVFEGFESFTRRADFDDFARSAQSRAFLESMKPVLSQPLEVTFLSPLP